MKKLLLLGVVMMGVLSSCVKDAASGPVDYQKAKDLDKPWGPFCLTLQQKRILVLLSTLENGTSKDATDWISFFKERNLPINVADWLQIQQFEWFTEKGNHLLSLDLKKINYYETALKYAQNIKGTV